MSGSRIRVLTAVTRLELGGAQRVALHTAGHLDPAAFEAALAWGPGDVLDGEARTLSGVTRYEIADLVRPVAPASDLKALVALRRAIRDFQPQIVHTHSSKAGVLGRFAARLERVPVVVHTVHGFGFTPLQSAIKRRLFFTAEKIAARWTDHFVAVSRVNLERGVELGLWTENEASVIRAGIDLHRVRRAGGGGRSRERLGIPAGAPLITQIGNFKPQKAPLDFVRAAAVIGGRVPEAWFVMAGDGPLRAAAEALAGELGIADRLCFPGWWGDVPDLLAATTVSVLSSRHEGLPCSVVESLAAGVPVVATAVDGTPEVIEPGVNGELVAAGDWRGLAEAVTGILVEDGRRRAMSEAAVAGLDGFDRDVMVRQLEELYRCLTSGCSPS
ncbi:MAG: glycosyltransferase family 4 protein [Thermoanaerobaculales bacterium]|nr:glycosyltransferase family 4 protein [Thermoanaerobaculales bacterium]